MGSFDLDDLSGSKSQKDREAAGDSDEVGASADTDKDHLGRINFSVAYDFDTQTLTVKIIRAEKLAAKDLSGTSDPYVKISLLPDKRHTLTTNVKRKNLNPRWNEIFAFEGQNIFVARRSALARHLLWRSGCVPVTLIRIVPERLRLTLERTPLIECVKWEMGR